MPCTFTITSQRQTTMANPAGGFMDAFEVRFTTEQGYPSRVMVPAAQFTPDNVKALIERQCEVMTEIQNMGS